METQIEEWSDEDQDTFVSECEQCNIVRPVQMLEDPFIREVYPEDENDLSTYCLPCWNERRANI